MCDLKSFSFLHHFGSGFKYFSATIIRKLSKMAPLPGPTRDSAPSWADGQACERKWNTRERLEV